MFKRLLLLVVGLVILAGCAKPPVEDREETRRMIAYAYAAGASRLAAAEYRAASEALQKAEWLVRQGSYRAAKVVFSQAQELSARALSLTVQRKSLYSKEQQELTEQRAREAAERKAQKERHRQKLKKKRPKPIPPPAPKPAPAPKPEPDSEPKLVDQVEVQVEETLASISARKDVYLDAMLWTLIYKANRDQIKDPKEIFPGQILLIPRGKSSEEVDAARLEAQELNLF